MIIKIKLDSEIPIYEQLRRQFIIAIAKGEFLPGEELPSVRQLSGDLGINLHTVNKTYNILREEGYLRIDRRKGTMVKESLPEDREEYLKKLKKELAYLLGDGKNRGLTQENIIELVKEIYKDMEK